MQDTAYKGDAGEGKKLTAGKPAGSQMPEAIARNWV